MPRKIAMVGTASSGKQAPYNDPDYEIWCVSARANYVTRADRWFELHRLDGEDPAWAENWRNTIRSWSRDIPAIYMIYPEPDLGNVVPYPVDRMVARFGSFFMTSSFAWMMAMAIDEMAPHGSYAEPGSTISVFGVDMEYTVEYQQQRTGFRHFIEIAKLLGISVTRLATGGLSYDPVPYPFWQDDPLLSKAQARMQEARKTLATLNDSIRVTREMIATTKGAMNEIGMLADVMPDRAYERRAALEKQLSNLLATSAQISKDIVLWESASEERHWLIDYLST